MVITTINDLKANSRNKPFSEVQWSDIMVADSELMLKADTYLYVDDDCNVKVLKSRFGGDKDTTLDKIFIDMINDMEARKGL